MNDETLSRLCRVLAGQADQVNWSAFLPADWQEFVVRGQAHGVAPLLYYTLQGAGWPEQVPAQVRATLQREYYTTKARNMLFYTELARILNALQGIPVVVLKGAALASTLYPDIGLRPMVDLDLLVPREKLETAVQIMRRQGYYEPVPEIVPGFHRTHLHHVCLQLADSHHNTLVELHWKLIGGDANRHSPSTGWFWEHTERLILKPWLLGQSDDGEYEQIAGGTAFLQLTPEAHLLYLAAHLIVQHRAAGPRLLWLYDQHLIMTRYAELINWDELLEQSLGFHWDTALYTALMGTRERFGTYLPEELLNGWDRLYRLPNRHALQPQAQTLHTRASGLWDELTELNWQGRLYLLRAHLFPSPKYLHWRYQLKLPSWLWFLYYPYRWFDFGSDMWRTLARVVRRYGRGSG